MVQTHEWPVNVGEGIEICPWIAAHGGPFGLVSLDVLHCYQAYAHGPPQGDVTFTPTSAQVIYTYQYYMATTQAQIDAIDVNSGCDF
jgi:hypothetical protein